jgi:hypothetical protein
MVAIFLAGNRAEVESGRIAEDIEQALSLLLEWTYVDKQGIYQPWLGHCSLRSARSHVEDSSIHRPARWVSLCVGKYGDLERAEMRREQH